MSTSRAFLTCNWYAYVVAKFLVYSNIIDNDGNDNRLYLAQIVIFVIWNLNAYVVCWVSLAENTYLY